MTAPTSSGAAVVTLPTDSQILITREFAAPSQLVFRAWTTPDLIRRWWHANRGEVTVAEVDLRVGGRWRFVQVTPDGFEVAFSGEYREIVPGQRLVWSEIYERMPDAPALQTMTLTERDGRTGMTILGEYGSRQVRDAVLESGMEAGMQDALSLLERVAVSEH
ncbi:SRPBCC family protein [Jatrophihabitans sp.]|uniref:SRPBCC family protein n=1 Tax=Jatrophihabitans sp. TaxID=1932789 RepID=UPI002C12A13D|nr:SRPBCC family protein [Jatrophihabitans sp.]